MCPLGTLATAAMKHRAKDQGEDGELKVLNALLLCGVNESIARLKAKDITAPSEATFVEMYGRGAVVREANTARRDSTQSIT